jgi:hypothetical protein
MARTKVGFVSVFQAGRNQARPDSCLDSPTSFLLSKPMATVPNSVRDVQKALDKDRRVDAVEVEAASATLSSSTTSSESKQQQLLANNVSHDDEIIISSAKLMNLNTPSAEVESQLVRALTTPSESPTVEPQIAYLAALKDFECSMQKVESEFEDIRLALDGVNDLVTRFAPSLDLHGFNMDFHDTRDLCVAAQAQFEISLKIVKENLSKITIKLLTKTSGIGFTTSTLDNDE